MSSFHKYWSDLKKHEKRIRYWLPRIREVAAKVGDKRSLRYFTLCARTMIDVFMLIREGVLHRDPSTGAIEGVRFCEYEGEDYTEIKDLIAREDAGFRGYLEKIVLFEDDDYTAGFTSLREIAKAFSDDEALANSDRGRRLREKRVHLLFAESFPFDYLNLDYCARFYEPPDVWAIRNSIFRMLGWQRDATLDGAPIDEFVAAVTCRLDGKFPGIERDHLVSLVESNRSNSAAYAAAFAEQWPTDSTAWLGTDPRAFFLSSWPKDIGALSSGAGWEMETLDYVFYDRVGKSEQYLMVCLIARFQRSSEADYLSAAISALHPECRVFIEEPPISSELREELIADLRSVVALRNDQARHAGRDDMLPDPGV